MKSFKKDLGYFLVICGIISFLTYQATADIILSISVWAVYALCLITGKLFEYFLSKKIPSLHVEIIVAWIVYLIICLSISVIDIYLIMPQINKAVDFPLPLSFSLLVWIAYGFILAVITLLQYRLFTFCPKCKGVTLKKGNYCAGCGIAFRKSDEQTIILGDVKSQLPHG